jgi:DNA repair exonuclease SbcCD ATPase subunit
MRPLAAACTVTLLLLTSGCLFSSHNPVTERISSSPATRPAVTTAGNPTTLQDDAGIRLMEMQQRIEELTELLATTSARPANKRPEEGLLQALEQKAKRGDAITAELNTIQAKTEAMRTERNECQKAITTMESQMKLLQARTNELAQTLIELTSKLTPLEENIRMLRLGNFEYYTVRAGDTCKSIAAQQFVYGDETKHILIRQANREQVADLDNLVPATVLIIPRPNQNAVHEL